MSGAGTVNLGGVSKFANNYLANGNDAVTVTDATPGRLATVKQRDGNVGQPTDRARPVERLGTTRSRGHDQNSINEFPSGPAVNNRANRPDT